ncbi:MAG TPA: Ig-like domain-containing protein [Dongiaceae bacterium]|jgi:hypothetical protein|nr:Ig-like domain-containing protein [Dongiaceae bacterium]
MNSRTLSFWQTAAVGLWLWAALNQSRAGSLTGSYSSVAAGTDVNLTAAGKLDWVHWGLYTDTSVDRKATVTPSIGDISLVGDSNGFLAVYQYADNTNGYSWSDGLPNAGITNTTTGVWAYSTIPVGSGFQIQVPAGTSPRTLQVYVGSYNGKGKFTAVLSDGSAPGFTNASNGTVNNHGNGPGGVFALDYTADSTNAVLTITWTLETLYGADANVTLQAATLSAPGADNPPYVLLTSPADGAAFPAQSNISFTAEARDFDGTVTNVALYVGTNKLADATVAPYDFVWTNAPGGQYPIMVAATDDQGVTSWSQPRQLFVYGTGGSETGAVAAAPATVDLTAEGPADWAHWGLTASNSFDHKSGVVSQISDFIPLGTNPVQAYSDNYTAFTWSDGTPTSSAAGTPTGVFVTGITNGFQLTVAADTTPRQLRLYVGGYGVQAELQASLSDLSAAPYTDTSVNNQYGNTYAVYTINYAAASANQSLQVTFRAFNLYDLTYGNVTLQAATLESSTISKLPVHINNPAVAGNEFIFAFATQTNVSYVIEASDVLPATNWVTLATIPGTGGNIIATNQMSNDQQQFYRVETQ